MIGDATLFRGIADAQRSRRRRTAKCVRRAQKKQKKKRTGRGNRMARMFEAFTVNDRGDYRAKEKMSSASARRSMVLDA